MTRKGIDVASYQHPNGAGIDYGAAVGAGFDWAAVKLGGDRSAHADGGYYVNPFGLADVAGFRDAGAETIGYWFAEPDYGTPEQDARRFLELAADAGHLDGLALDLERGQDLGADRLVDYCQRFHAVADLRFLYCNRNYWSLVGPGLNWGTGFLWLADPGATGPAFGAVVVQNGQGPIPGVVGNPDQNLVFYDRAPSSASSSSSPAADGPPDFGPVPTLRRGDRGPWVTVLQHHLATLVAPLELDGIFGQHTQDAVVHFQREHGLSADAVVGRRTWAALGIQQ